MVRWTEGQLSPVGGQAQYTYSFASHCKAIHSWYGLDEVVHIAYLCEGHLYVDTGGTLTNISPTPALTLPQVRWAIARLLRRVLGCDRVEVLRRTMTRRLRRNEEARHYHYKARKRLAPQRLNQRCYQTQYK